MSTRVSSPGKGSPQSTILTLPTPVSRTGTKESHHPKDSHETAVLEDLEEAALGAVEDADEKRIHEKVEALEDGWDTNPHNPRTWSGARKWQMAGAVSLYTFVSPLASSMMAPALLQVAHGYHITNSTVAALTLSIFLLAYALGPLVLAPLSEIYGRTWVLHIANIFFIAFNIGCAVAPDTASLIVLRFLAGLAGSAPLSIGAGSISDLFAEDNRAAAMGIFSLGPLIGPVVGPVAGGFISENLSYHWIFWVIAMIAGLASIVGIPVLRETYAPVIIARLAKAEGRPTLQPQETLGQVLYRNLTRPVILLTRSFICMILSLYMAIIYGIMYLMFVTFPELYSEKYGWGPGIAGLAYLGPGVGFLIGTLFCAKVMDPLYIKLRAKNGGQSQPEHRIPVMFIGSVLVPVGLLWYGWSADKGLHWIMPIIGSGFFGAAMMLCFLPIQVYLVDSFKYAASAVAAATLLRSAFGFVFPLFADRIFKALGVGPGYSLVAGISVLVGWPFPVWIYYKGAAIRARSDLNR